MDVDGVLSATAGRRRSLAGKVAAAIAWLLGMVEVAPPDATGRGRIVPWAVGALKGPDGRLRVDPKGEYLFRLGRSYPGQSSDLQSRNFSMALTGIPIPLELFELRGEMGPDLVVRASGQPVALDYRNLLQTSADGSANVTAVTLTLPKKAKLPPAFRVYFMTDPFPLAEKDFGG